MEDFPIALILIILSIVSAVMKNKKKQEKKAQKQARKQVPVSPHKPVQAKPAPAVPAMSVWDEAERELAPAAPSMGMEGTDACHDYMLPKVPKTPSVKTLENHIPASPVMGADGTDPCHDFMLKDASSVPVEAEDETGMAPEEAKELVRGIILSEILTRPQNRYARRMP